MQGDPQLQLHVRHHLRSRTWIRVKAQGYLVIIGFKIQTQTLFLESILPNFHFSRFPIFAGKLECFLHMEKNASAIK